MIESVEYNGNLYGASVQEFRNKITGDCVFVAEPQGVKQIKNIFPNAYVVYVTTASEETRFRRLLSRGPVEARLRINLDRKIFAEGGALSDYTLYNEDDRTPEEAAGSLYLSLRAYERKKKVS